MNCEGTISMHTLYSFHKNGNFITAKEEELEETLGSIIAAGISYLFNERGLAILTRHCDTYLVE